MLFLLRFGKVNTLILSTRQGNCEQLKMRSNEKPTGMITFCEEVGNGCATISGKFPFRVLTKNISYSRVYSAMKINLSNRMQILKGRNVFFHSYLMIRAEAGKGNFIFNDCPLCFLCILKHSQEFLASFHPLVFRLGS